MRDKNENIQLKNIASNSEKTMKELEKSFAPLTQLSKDIDNLLLPYANAFGKIVESYQLINNQIGAAINLAIQKQDHINNEMSRVINTVNSLGKNLSVWAETYSYQFEAIAKSLEEFENKYEIAKEVAVRCMHRYKWFISPNMPPDFIFEMVIISQKRGNRTSEINKLFVNLIFEQKYEFINELLIVWKPKMDKTRYKIIKDCILAIQQNNKDINISNIVIPTLIVQIDGILSDFLSKNKLRFTTYQTKKDVFKKNYSPNLSEDLDLLANNMLLDILFQKSNPGKPLEISFQMNRHKILHAENKYYGKKVYLARLLLIIDYLVNLP